MPRSGFGQAARNSLPYVINGATLVSYFACVKSILLEVDDFYFPRFSFTFSSIFRKKKEKEQTLQGKVRDFKFLCRFSRTRGLPYDPSQILVYLKKLPAKKLQNLREDNMRSDPNPRVPPADMTSLALIKNRSDLDRTSRGTFGLNTLKNARKSSFWTSSGRTWHLDRGPWTSTEDELALPLLSLSFAFSFPAIAKLCNVRRVLCRWCL